MRIDPSFVILESGQNVEDALGAVPPGGSVHYVVIRRELGDSVFWYTIRVDAFLRRIANHPVRQPIEVALELHERDAVPVHPEGATEGDSYRPGAVVISPRGRVMGVLEMVYLAPPPTAEAPRRNRRFRDLLRFGRPKERRGEAGAPPDESVHAPGEYMDAGPKAMPPAADERPATTAAPPPTTPTAPEKRAFQAWPDLGAPVVVEEHQIFDLVIGFARSARADVSGGPVVLDLAPPEFDLHIQVAAAGFDAPEGWTRMLHVVRDNPWSAHVTVELVATDGIARSEVRSITVLFHFEGQLCGQARRKVVVVPQGTAIDSATPMAADVAAKPSTTGVPVRVKPGLRAPDLTATIQLTTGRASREVFLWTFESPHSVALPETPATTEFDTGVGAYVDSVLQQLVALSGEPTADNQMRGIGRQIARRMPAAFWSVLKQVSQITAGAGRAPDVLLVTEETRLPWELAWMPEPLDPARAAHLGAQVNLGRWILGDSGPALPPEDRLPYRNIVVVVGNYPKGAGVAALPDAVAEADWLKQKEQSRATVIEMEGTELDSFLEGEVPVAGCELIHFACHGRSKTGAPAETHLVMQGGQTFTPQVLEGSEIGAKWAPLLFLNACEVGRAGVALGETAGFAGAALYQGCRAFVGPLWQVQSDVAREIAEAFYTGALAGEPIAAVLRDIRAKYIYSGPGSPPSPDTYLAYVYYGHPALRLECQP